MLSGRSLFNCSCDFITLYLGDSRMIKKRNKKDEKKMDIE